jgi:hypothetical protein
MRPRTGVVLGRSAPWPCTDYVVDAHVSSLLNYPLLPQFGDLRS